MIYNFLTNNEIIDGTTIENVSIHDSRIKSRYYFC